MLQVYKRMKKMREKYVDTLAKLYEYATTVYSKKQYTQWYDTKEGGYTYGSFKNKCDSISKKLTQYGIGAGDKVVILSRTSLLTLPESFFDTKITLLSEWLMMFVTSFSELSGRIGMEILPNGTVAKNATDQLGMLCERMATLSPAPIPYCVNFLDMLSHLFLKEP